MIQPESVSRMYESPLAKELYVENDFVKFYTLNYLDFSTTKRNAAFTKKFIDTLKKDDTRIVLFAFNSIGSETISPFKVDVSMFPKKTKYYVLSGYSNLAIARKTEFMKVLPTDTKYYPVRTEVELRSTLGNITALPSGVIVINVFVIEDDWSKVKYYDYIDSIVASKTPKDFISLGVCSPTFTTDYALGPSVSNIASYLTTNPTFNNCVRVESLRKFQYYTESMEVYK